MADDSEFSYPKYDLKALRQKCHDTEFLAKEVGTHLVGTEILTMDTKFLPLLHYHRKSCLEIKKAEWGSNSIYKSEQMFKNYMAMDRKVLKRIARNFNVVLDGNPCKIAADQFSRTLECPAFESGNCVCEDAGKDKHGILKAWRPARSRCLMRFIVNALVKGKRLAALICLFVQEDNYKHLGLVQSHICYHRDLGRNKGCRSPGHSSMETTAENMLRQQHQKGTKCRSCHPKCLTARDTRKQNIFLVDDDVVYRDSVLSDEEDNTGSDGEENLGSAPEGPSIGSEPEVKDDHAGDDDTASVIDLTNDDDEEHECELGRNSDMTDEMSLGVYDDFAEVDEDNEYDEGDGDEIWTMDD